MSRWLPLLEYSAKNGVSLSTLRRRIKENAIDFKMEHGKYYIHEAGPSAKGQMHASAASQASVAASAAPVAMSASPSAREVSYEAAHSNPPQSLASSFVEASVLTSANRLVEELKAAYAKILQEKEEQISQLKEEIVDLRMLARILEAQMGTKSDTPSKPAENGFMFGEIQLKDI